MRVHAIATRCKRDILCVMVFADAAIATSLVIAAVVLVAAAFGLSVLPVYVLAYVGPAISAYAGLVAAQLSLGLVCIAASVVAGITRPHQSNRALLRPEPRVSARAARRAAESAATWDRQRADAVRPICMRTTAAFAASADGVACVCATLHVPGIVATVGAFCVTAVAACLDFQLDAPVCALVPASMSEIYEIAIAAFAYATLAIVGAWALGALFVFIDLTLLVWRVAA